VSIIEYDNDPRPPSAVVYTDCLPRRAGLVILTGGLASRLGDALAALEETALRDPALVARIAPDLQSPLDRLCARRTIAFGHLFGVGAELVRDVPAQL
jgi:hypothetical protein